MEAFESFEHAGMQCELHTDEEPMSPDEWDDQLGTLVGIGGATRDYRAFNESGVDADAEAAERRPGLLRRYLRMCGLFAVPFYFAEGHGYGASIYETDDEPNGYIYTTPARVAELGAPLEDVERQLRGELQEWSHYFNNEVVGYVVRDPSGAVVDSCWGFYPDESTPGDPLGLEHVRAEARAAAEHEANERARAARAGIATRKER